MLFRCVYRTADITELSRSLDSKLYISAVRYTIVSGIVAEGHFFRKNTVSLLAVLFLSQLFHSVNICRTKPRFIAGKKLDIGDKTCTLHTHHFPAI